MKIACVLLPIHCASFSSSYLDSLSPSKADPVHISTTSYLESLGGAVDCKEGCIPGTQKTFDLQMVAAETPDDHYAKDNPGAGWAGYKHPSFGGYLDNLKENVWEEGKVADYGDDIRWGAQVYLDALKGEGR